MKVRNHIKLVSEYKGRWADASDADCPCRPCWSPHDCGYRGRDGKMIVDMQCAHRYNQGCPNPKPEPHHYFKSERSYVCARCKARRTKAVAEAIKAKEAEIRGVIERNG